MEKVKPYIKKLDIKYIKRSENYKIHCPGNTRRDGLAAAQGEWIVFIDNDDAFEPDVFTKVKEEIKIQNCKEVMFTFLGAMMRKLKNMVANMME